MRISLIFIVFLMIAFPFTHAEGKTIFNIKSLCQASESVAKSILPVEFGLFEIEEIKHNHEAIWSLKNNKSLEALGLYRLSIKIHNKKVKSVWFKNRHASELNLKENLKIAGL